VRACVIVCGGVVLALAAADVLETRRSANADDGAARRVAITVQCTALSDCALAEHLAEDIWSEAHAEGDPIDVVVREPALETLRAAGVRFSIIDSDIDETARTEAVRVQATAAQDAAYAVASADLNPDFFKEFRDATAIEARLSQLAALAPERATVRGVGSTLEGRTIWALRVRGAGDNGAPPMPMLINGAQHAREWISAMSVSCIADRLVRDYDTDAAVRAFVDGTDAWIIPVVNPDGYQYSWSQDRYWRKNRREGFGVDLNRNYSVAFGGAGSSGQKRSDIYRGDRAFSENETAALRALVRRENIALHIDFHAYGQLVLYPWTYTAERTDDHARLAATGDRLASAIYGAHQNRYRLMRGVELYPASGTMTDWMYGEAKATSYTIELRPRAGGSGFVLPPKEIVPTCNEAMAAVLALRASPQRR